MLKQQSKTISRYAPTLNPATNRYSKDHAVAPCPPPSSAVQCKVRAGDFIFCPTGGPETAHQLVNDSGAELAYISVSTMMPAEVCEYPDSGKVGSFGAGGLRHMTPADGGVDYWKDEA